MLPTHINYRRSTLFISCILIIAACIAYYVSKPPPLGENLPGLPQQAEMVRQDAKIKVNADTDIVQKILYLKCGDEEVFRTKPAERLVGLSYEQVQKVYAGWLIEKFDTNEIEMSLQVNSLCREHANNMYIGVHDGYIAVYYGKPGSKAVLKEVTSIATTQLTEIDLAELQKGLVVHSKEELLKTIEGMYSR
jgi:hypothetical protein